MFEVFRYTFYLAAGSGIAIIFEYLAHIRNENSEGTKKYFAQTKTRPDIGYKLVSRAV